MDAMQVFLIELSREKYCALSCYNTVGHVELTLIELKYKHINPFTD
jgi:hypothetical protein